MASKRQDVEFKTLDGTTLRAWLYPAQSKGPCIIMSHGFSGIKHHFLDNFAVRFQSEGWTTLVYDNRNWGESEGLPRQQIDPQQQVKDYYDAFEYVASLPEVNASKIVYWGSSLSGGNVICAAAVDKRIAAVISQVPFVSGEQASANNAAMLPLLFHNRANVHAGIPSAVIPVTPETLEEAQSGHSHAVLGSVDAFNFNQATASRGGDWKNEVTVQSMLNLMSHEPQAFIHRIAPTPFLMVVSEHDSSIPTPQQLAMFHLAREPKKLAVLKGVGHFDVYTGQAFEENISIQVDFLRENL
ncbi:Polyketide transferase [Lachnellula suecica]|uniref:Polyketide transferase n=1 Tax=Lachnellula suecica TaxID=602035 RepID=A0A8T9CG90_9HELO|nr:Polyketide transferase [Lachnellula suecica]